MRFLVALLVILLVGCNSGSTLEERAVREALASYQLLKDGELEDFMNCRAGIDSLPVDYRVQLLKSIELYSREICDKHGGLSDVRVSPIPAKNDTVFNVVYAFLTLCFSDSTQEEISVPMVIEHGEWKMK